MDPRNRFLTAAIGLLAIVAIAACGEGDAEQVETGDTTQPETTKVETVGTTTCPTKSPPVWEDGVELTVENVTDRLADALTCPEHVAYAVARLEDTPGGADESGTIEFWLDIENEVVRIESGPGTFNPPLQIANAEGDYRQYSDDADVNRTDASPLCAAYDDIVLSYLIDTECFFFGSSEGVSVETETYEDKSAVVLRSQRLFPAGPDEEDGVVSYDYRLFLDPETYVVLALMNEETLDGTSLPAEHTETTFELEFVPRATLAADFFEPASIGYVEPVVDLDELDGTIYWFGEHVPAAEGFLPLELNHVWSAEDAVAQGSYIGIVDYEPDVALHQYALERIERIESFLEPSLIPRECLAETIELDLEAGRGVIHGTASDRSASDGECGPATHYTASVIFDDTAVRIFTSENTNAPFDSAKGMQYLARMLTRRE